MFAEGVCRRDVGEVQVGAPRGTGVGAAGHRIRPIGQGHRGASERRDQPPGDEQAHLGPGHVGGDAEGASAAASRHVLRVDVVDRLARRIRRGYVVEERDPAEHAVVGVSSDGPADRDVGAALGDRPRQEEAHLIPAHLVVGTVLCDRAARRDAVMQHGLDPPVEEVAPRNVREAVADVDGPPDPPAARDDLVDGSVPVRRGASGRLRSGC